LKKVNIKESAIVAVSRFYLSLLGFFLKGKFTVEDLEKTIGNFIDKSKTSYISSIDEDGFPNIKAMLSPSDRDGIKTIYFSTNASSLRVSQYRKNPKASIYFCDQRFFRGVMLKGEIEVLDDGESKRRIWQDGDTLYYPKGVDDPDYCVLRFTSKSGRYYSNMKSESFEL